jgi:hypothetical protein
MDPSDRRITELHLTAARKAALRLFCTASTMFPDEWGGDVINETLHVDLTEFAIHARRVSELCDLMMTEFPGADATRFQISEPSDFPLMKDYHKALSRLVHARKLVVGYALWTGPKIWLNSAKDKAVSYVRVETDRYPAANISVFGIATCFLSEVIIAVKRRFPEYRF